VDWVDLLLWGGLGLLCSVERWRWGQGYRFNGGAGYLLLINGAYWGWVVIFFFFSSTFVMDLWVVIFM
jgi:hypothetical protein